MDAMDALNYLYMAAGSLPNRADLMNSVRARIAELEAERAELVKDRERLDCLELFVKQGSMVDFAAFMDQYDHNLWEITITRANDCWQGNDIRQAIDAAREGE